MNIRDYIKCPYALTQCARAPVIYRSALIYIENWLYALSLRPSEPGCTSTIRANSHLEGGTTGFWQWPSRWLWYPVMVRPFITILQRVQVLSTKIFRPREPSLLLHALACTSCHRDNRFALTTNTDSSGSATSRRPIKKWVNADK